MRFHKDEVFEETLYLWPKGVEQPDADAIPYYIDYGDGKPLFENYNYKTHSEYDCYGIEPYKAPYSPDPKKNKKLFDIKDKLKNIKL